MAVRRRRPVGTQQLPDVVTEQRACRLGPTFELEPVPGGDARSRRRAQEREEPPVGMIRVRTSERQLAIHPQELDRLRCRRLLFAESLLEAACRLRAGVIAGVADE